MQPVSSASTFDLPPMHPLLLESDSDSDSDSDRDTVDIGEDPPPPSAPSAPSEPADASDNKRKSRKKKKVEKVEGKVEEHKSYVCRWQIWHEKDKKWDAFDPEKEPLPEVKEYPNAYFIVNHRYKTKYEEPELVLSNWADGLLSFMRATVGDDFFQDKPEYPVQKLFLQMKNLRKKYARAKELVVAKGYLGFADKVKEVEGLGFLEATRPTTSWAMCKTYLTKLLEQLDPLMTYMNEQYAPLEAKLIRMQEYGQMDWDMLLYYFEPGQKLYEVDCSTGRPDAFVLIDRSIQTRRGVRSLVLTGYAYRFDGDSYVKRLMQTKIVEYGGTRPFDSLAAIMLDAKAEEYLKKRGQVYSTFAGVHHKDYKGQRVIVDAKAYTNREGYDRDSKAVIDPLSEVLLYLLPPDIEGFNLSNKVCRECQRLSRYCEPDTCQTWQKFDVTKLKDVVFDENAWGHLVLDADTKLLIEALVRVTDNSNTSENIISDVISGKGGGLISVLHGPPGTGKTLTAESIAEHLHRPMYMVGFAELSTTANKLESSLRKILKLATAWDAVLLIDEADVFLEQRSLHELERNALVSVALRLLEYHRGVLFLTTNRITTFDEAFLSRFSIAIKYNELDLAGRFSVWKKFFELAGCRIEGSEDEFTKVDANVSSEDLEELAEKPFNGRTIKNLVRTAQALALSQKKPLSAEHVKTVVRVQEKFLREFATTK